MTAFTANRFRWIPAAVALACGAPENGVAFSEISLPTSPRSSTPGPTGATGNSGMAGSGMAGSGASAGAGGATAGPSPVTSSDGTPATPSGGAPSASAGSPAGPPPQAGTPPVPGNAAGGAGAAPPPEPATPPPVVTPPPAPAAALVLECPSYDDGFLPLAHEPVCSACHGQQRGLPDWGDVETAQDFCGDIGQEVASGSMPPGGGLSADQRTLIARWVALGCPETRADANGLCQQPGGAAPPPAVGASTISINRVRLRGDTLEIRGDVSSESVTLTVEFDGRTETLENDNGEFRAEFDVDDNPGTVTVRASDGTTITVTVEEDD